MNIHAYDLVWTKLKSGTWWPGVIKPPILNELDCFEVDDHNIMHVTLLGCQKIVSLSHISASDDNISWKPGQLTESLINQDVDDSLMSSYRLALSLAASSYPQYFVDPHKYTSTSTITIGPLIPSSSSYDTSKMPLNFPKLQDDMICRPISSSLSSSSSKPRIKKRADVLLWDDYFMSVAFLSSMRSKDPSTQVGACIVNDDMRIVGIGYNGFPRGCSDDELPWDRIADDELDTKYPYVCHAEVNAILNKNSADVRGCKMYVALFPCNECSKIIIQSGIKEVIYLSDKYHDTIPMRASRRMLDLAGVKCREHRPSKEQVFIDFTKI